MPRTASLAAPLTRLRARLGALTCWLALAGPVAAAPFAHVQTDKPVYRLGDTAWVRVHQRDASGLTLTLEGPGGPVPVALTRAGEGSLFLDPARPGGACELVARSAAGEVLHRLPLEVYDLRARQLDLSLRILGEFVYPGEEVRAAFFARDLEGRPLAGVRGRWQARFGPVVVEGLTPPTDPEGGVVLRFPLPAEALDSGWLTVGLERGEQREAIARPVSVCGHVGKVELFPEGGAIVPGHPHRLGVLVRDRDGLPTPAEGRVVDDTGAVVEVLEADRFGQAALLVPYEAGRRYTLQIDRPAGVEERFPLPGATGHAHALRLEQAEGGDRLRAWVWGAAGELELIHLRDGQRLDSGRLRLKEGVLASIDFPVRAGFGVDEVLVAGEGRAWLRAATVRGQGWPLAVEVKPVAGGTTRDEVTLEVLTRQSGLASQPGKPVAADVALSVFRDPGQGWTWQADLPARALLAPHVVGALPAGLGDLFAPGPAAAQRREACLLVRAAWAYPLDGVALPERGLPDPAQHRALPAPLAARRRAAASADATQVRRDALGELMARASFTRPLAPGAEQPVRFGAAAAAPPASARAQRKPPQETKVPADRPDERDALCWEGRVSTGRDGRALIKFRLGDDTARLAVVCQGLSGAVGLGTAAETSPQAAFEARLALPDHVNVGDRIETWLEVEVRDGRRDPLDVTVVLPPCLRTSVETSLRFDPAKSAPRLRLPLEVVAAAERARAQVITRRGLLVHELTHTFDADHGEATLTVGRAGTSSGAERFSLTIPAEAVPGSVEVFASLAPAPPPPTLPSQPPREGPPPTPAMVLDDLESMLHEPYGCFEQTTSTNWPNLVVLQTLLETGVDAHALDKAWALAEAGYRRLLSFRNSGSGGFALYPGQPPAARYTALALPQLAAFASLFRGRGTAQLEEAARWLRQQPEQGASDELHLALSFHEAGRVWPRRAEVLKQTPKTAYERAALARVIGTWVGEWPAQARPRAALQAELIHELVGAQEATGLIPSTGSGLLSSGPETLAIETTALAIPSLVEAGQEAQAGFALAGLAAARCPGGGWGSTRATALAIRAFGWAPALADQDQDLLLASERAARAAATALPVTFTCASIRQSGLVGGPRDRSLRFGARLDAGPGAHLSLALTPEGEWRQLCYGLSASFRVRAPRSSPEAPFRIRTALSPQTHVGAEDLILHVDVERTGAPTRGGQVVARVALPGGLSAGEIRGGGCARIDVEEGQLVCYWESADRVGSLWIPLRATVPGRYRSGPSVVYPYYEAGKESWCEGHTLRVDDAFDMTEAMQALQQQGALQGAAAAGR